MSLTAQIKEDRINLRLNNTAKTMLERAAGFEGQTVSKFILNCAIEQAEKTIQAHETMSLNTVDSAAFFDALAAPVQFNNQLLAAFEEHERRIVNK